MKQPDGSYKISGTKIFISGGEQDLTENIIHLVIARIEGAPEGTKGISLFIVPKIMVNDDGTLGQKNGVSCGSIEHKMGIKGSSTCVMNYDNATGYLVGQENRGLAAMFVMMNEARLGVGVQGLALVGSRLSERRDLRERAPAGPRADGREIPQQAGRSDHRASGRAAHAAVHPRHQRGRPRARDLWLSLFGDISHRSQDPKERQHADDMMGLLTPVVKGVLTDYGFANAVNAQQMFGGHGYIAEWGMEQFVRDARIPMIYEGANGVQAMDLVGRKLPRDGGRAVMAFFGEVQAFVNAHKGDEKMKPYVEPLGVSLGHLQQATMWFMNNAMKNPDNAGAGANDYMHLFGLVALGLMWGRIVKAANEKLASGAAGNGGLDRAGAEEQADRGAVFRRADAAGNGGATEADRGGLGQCDGDGDGGVLSYGNRSIGRSPKIRKSSS